MSSVRFIGVPANVKTAVQMKLRMSGKAIAETAKHLCPVDTGMLRDSIWHKTPPAAGFTEVGAMAPYAGFVEFGTCKQRPQPFLRPALAMAALRMVWQGQWGSDDADFAGSFVARSHLRGKGGLAHMPQTPIKPLTKFDKDFLAVRAAILRKRKG